MKDENGRQRLLIVIAAIVLAVIVAWLFLRGGI